MTNAHSSDEWPWWRTGIIYQIYPRSFQDSNGDGIGDLTGILARLDYLQWLGVDAVWLSPVYPSPMADFGYDVSDYTDIEPMFGTLDDFARLRDAVHARGMKLIMDLVPNHTSDRHPWFIESRRSRDNPKRGWYVWRDANPSDGVPNNWLSEFGGSAWTWDDATGQYYYHAYLAAQPDLNWRNPEVQAEFERIFRFWFAHGVDGFRIDTVQHLFEDEALRDNPPDPAWRVGQPPTAALLRRYTTDLPELFDVLKRWRALADEYGGRVLISEAYVPLAGLAPYYGAANDAMHLPFNFHLIGAPWRADTLAELIQSYERILPPGGWPNWVLGNHDRSRIASRIGREQALNAAILLLTLRGTPTMYYGDELGMADVPIPPELVQDPWEKNVGGFGLGRDPVRTPMRWDASRNAGFTSGEPWLPLGALVEADTVAGQHDDPHSLLSHYRALIALRRREPVLNRGAYASVWSSGTVLCYVRVWQDRRILVCLNLGTADERIALPEGRIGEMLFAADPLKTPAVGTRQIVLPAHHGIVAVLT